MAGFQHRDLLPNTVAASALAAYVPVKASASTAGQVVPCTANTDDVIGVTIATVATFSTDAQVCYQGFTKLVAAASLGYGARVQIGSTNGAVTPFTPSGVASALGNVQAVRYQLGRAYQNAAAGQVFLAKLDFAEVF
jgi:hypothetical protein